ncbi:hypothetical protein [Planifilum fimeticola]
MGATKAPYAGLVEILARRILANPGAKREGIPEENRTKEEGNPEEESTTKE